MGAVDYGNEMYVMYDENWISKLKDSLQHDKERCSLQPAANADKKKFDREKNFLDRIRELGKFETLKTHKRRVAR